MFGAAQPDTFRPKCPRLNGVTRNVRVGANLHGAVRVGPQHELLEFRVIRRGIQRVQLAFDHPSCGAIERNPVAFFECLALHPHLTGLIIHLDVARARHAALAHAASHHRCVTRHATA
jgi:hypothetical protein